MTSTSMSPTSRQNAAARAWACRGRGNPATFSDTTVMRESGFGAGHGAAARDAVAFIVACRNAWRVAPFAGRRPAGLVGSRSSPGWVPAGQGSGGRVGGEFVGVLTRDEVHHTAGDGDRVVGEPFVVPAD